MGSTPDFLHLLILFLSFLHNFHANSIPIFPKETLPTKAGYLPINLISNSAIFFAFYEAQQAISPLPQSPLLFWLQGGPGCSSMLGNFFKLGPWRVNSNYEDNKNTILKPNPGAWKYLFGIVFIDNTIGTGFNIALSPEEIPKDQETVAKHLSIALCMFTSLNPSLKSRPIYITSESYAGKYVPAIGYYILQQNSCLPVSRQVNLRGIAIGLTDPITQVATHAMIVYYSGLIKEQMTQVEEIQNEAVRLIEEGKWSEATNASRRVSQQLQNMTGLATLYDLRRKKPYETDLVTEFVTREEVKKALGVEKSMVWEECSSIVASALQDDVMKSV